MNSHYNDQYECLVSMINANAENINFQERRPQRQNSCEIYAVIPIFQFPSQGQKRSHSSVSIFIV